MRNAAWLCVVLWVAAANAQTISTRCQAQEVAVAQSTIDLRLVGCGESFPDNLLWNLDRADSATGDLDAHLTRTATGKGAVVYMIDTGIMHAHDEFQRTPASNVIAGIDANPNPKNPCTLAPVAPCWSTDTTLQIETHGTATASVVAGKNTGIAPDATLVAVYAESAGTDIDRWIGMLNAICNNAWEPGTPPFRTAIVNMSFVPAYATPANPKFPEFEAKMRAMIGGVDASGNPDPNGKRFLFVTIAGNHVSGAGDQCDANMNSNLYPAVLGSSIDGLITVGGIDETNHVWDRSCRGDGVDVLAPATNLLVASISDRDHYRSGHIGLSGYPTNSGTSYAAPYVSGIAALLLEENPDLTPEQIENMIKSHASHVANADEKTAMGRVAIVDLVSKKPRGRVVKH